MIDSDKHQVFLHGNEIDLNHSEFKLLNHLTAKPGWVFNRVQLIDAIRGDGYVVTDRIIDVVIVSLRKKLQDYGAGEILFVNVFKIYAIHLIHINGITNLILLNHKVH